MNPSAEFFTIPRLRQLSFALAILFFLAFCTKVCLNAFVSNVQSTASIVQNSVLSLCLVFIMVGISGYLIKNNTETTRRNTNIVLFLGGIVWVLGNVIAIITLNGNSIDLLNRGYLKPSINGSFNTTWIIIPQFILILYNLKLFLECDADGQCDKISWITLVILSFALIQTYLIVDSSRVIQQWPTDDARNNIKSV
jgi:hypothetical protein